MILEVKTQRVIHIPKGSTTYIVSYLDKNNYDMNYIDKIVLSFLGSPQSGWIDLQSENMTKVEFLYRLTTSKAALKKVTLIPGETYYFYLQELAKTLDISTYKLFNTYAKYAYKKDGNIIADTYHLPMGMNEEQLIKHLLRITEKKYKLLSEKIFGFYNKKNWYRYVTIASIIQKESASKQEMPLVSSVIHNRLKKGMKLQMDGTLNYSKYSHTKITPKMIKTDKSQYNTYKNKGLPNDPVCAIEFEAMRAAVFPTTTNYLYFMKSKDGSKHNFSSTYKAHRQNIKEIKKYKRAKKKLNKKILSIIKQSEEKKPIIKKRNLKNLWD
ncbi:MAG: endolytic transglycosylase MltG [Campylobacterota bacterium]|nr:endolytic transglycosylase MltG [Campylobacterota bacterium]